MSTPRNLLAFFICVALVGCSATGDEQLITKGIGSDLYTKDLYKETELLEQYAAYICVQANLPTIPDSGVVPANVVRCDYSRMTKPLWANFLIQGMNDIDRRCDAYLQWLDAKRRGKGALEKQIADTGRATTNILGFADVSAKAISIVGVAFGLLSDSVENYHSRLLLEIDGSTVATIVLTNRNKFRDDRNVYKAASKPEVIYVLRSYLRLCLPFAIEREINAFAANGVQGISGADARSPLDPGNVVTARTAESIPGANQDNTALTGENTGQNNPNVIKLFGPNSGYTIESVKNAQRRLCVEPTSTGAVGDQTTLAVTNYRRVLAGRVASGDDKLPLSSQEATQITSLSPCNMQKYTNWYESTILGSDAMVKSFVDKFNKVGGNSVSLSEGVEISSDKNSIFRMKIVEMRSLLEKDHNLTEKVPDGLKSYVTFEMYQAMNGA